MAEEEYGDEQPAEEQGYGDEQDDQGYGDEQPQEQEAAYEEPAEEEPQYEAPAEPEPEPEPEYKEPEPEPEPEPQYEAPQAVNAGYDASDIAKYCDDLYSDNPTFDYFYCTLVNAKKGLPDLQVEKSAKGGLPALVQEMQASAELIIFFLLRVNTYDDEGSSRAKFIYGRFVGSKVKFMQKAKLTPNLGQIADQFAVKHLSKDADEDMKDFTSEKLAKEFLRIGGAHKPARYDFGGGAVYTVPKLPGH